MKCVTSESYSLLINDQSVGMEWTDFRVGFSSLSFAFHGLNPRFRKASQGGGLEVHKILGDYCRQQYGAHIFAIDGGMDGGRLETNLAFAKISTK